MLGMSSEPSPFDVLGLPARLTATEELTAAYVSARREWFSKQFDPETMLVAHEKIVAIDEAYQSLRDTRRQSAILRETRKRPRPAGAEPSTGPARESSPPSPEMPRVVNRSKIVRELLRQAQQLVSKTKVPLADDIKAQMTRSAFDQGVDFTDAEEIVDRIAREVEIGVRPRTTRRPPAGS
jgi:curved DNA-binding protein CbpA